MFDTGIAAHAGYVVPPCSRKLIISLTQGLRQRYGANARDAFPIWDLVEDIDFLTDLLGNYDFQVVTHEEIGNCEGLVPFNADGKNQLLLRDDVYDLLTVGHNRARFTAAHELGHLLLKHHHVPVGLARTITRDVPVYRRSEWQANTFAGSLLLPPELAREAGNPHTAALFANMSPQAAEITMESYMKERML